MTDEIERDAAAIHQEPADAWARHTSTPRAEEWLRYRMAEWLRSQAADILLPHHLTDRAGQCGCGTRYTSHVQHLAEELAKELER